MLPLRRAVAVVGAAVVLPAVAGQPLPARAAPAVGDEPGESSPGVAVATEPMVRGTGRVFPVRGPTSYSSAHHDYPATDIFADCGSRIVSPITGTVLEVSRVDRWNPSTDRPPASRRQVLLDRGPQRCALLRQPSALAGRPDPGGLDHRGR